MHITEAVESMIGGVVEKQQTRILQGGRKTIGSAQGSRRDCGMGAEERESELALFPTC